LDSEFIGRLGNVDPDKPFIPSTFHHPQRSVPRLAIQDFLPYNRSG
jgi:hypothetical protein